MLYLTRTMISSVDLACYGVPRAKDWVSMDCGIRLGYPPVYFAHYYEG